MSHHLNLDAIRRNLLTSGLIDKDTAVVVLVQDRGTSLEREAAPIPAVEIRVANSEHESNIKGPGVYRSCRTTDTEALATVCNERSKAWADLRKARQDLEELRSELAERNAVLASCAAEVQTLKAQNQGLDSNQADMGMRARSDAWIEVVREIEKSSPDLLLASGCGAENTLNWIKQSARLREIFNQGLAETTAQ